MLGSATNIPVPRRAEELPGQRDRRFSRRACCARGRPKECRVFLLFLCNTEIKTTFLAVPEGTRVLHLATRLSQWQRLILGREGGRDKVGTVSVDLSLLCTQEDTSSTI